MTSAPDDLCAEALPTPRSLLPCPFCGSGNIDESGWLANDGRSGPACDDCGASADGIERWNSRAQPALSWIAEQARQLSSSKSANAVGALAWNLHIAFGRWTEAARNASPQGNSGRTQNQPNPTGAPQ